MNSNKSDKDPESTPLLLDKAAHQLSETERLAQESEMIGAMALSDLQRQREQVERNLAGLEEARREVRSSDRTITRIIRETWKTRVLMYAMLVTFILLVLWLVFYRNR